MPTRTGSERIDPSQFMLPRSTLTREYIAPSYNAGQTAAQPVQTNGGSMQYMPNAE